MRRRLMAASPKADHETGTYTDTDTDTDIHSDTQTLRHRQTQTNTDRHSDRDRHGQTQTDRQTQTQTQTQTHTRDLEDAAAVDGRVPLLLPLLVPPYALPQYRTSPSTRLGRYTPPKIRERNQAGIWG
eukprot:1028565-Rhodomonas_salina.1